MITLQYIRNGLWWIRTAILTPGLSQEMNDPLVHTDVFVCLRTAYVVQIICMNTYGTVRE